MALHFPLLTLEAEHGQDNIPRVLVRKRRVTQANAAAQATGIEPGLRLGTARALCRNLVAHQASELRQSTALEREARHLLNLTPQVCLAPPTSLLLEVGGCLKLFGGLTGLLARIDRYRLHCPLTTHLGLGLTPLGAWHLTDLPVLEAVPEPSRFQAWLAALPLGTLNLETGLLERLQAPGFRTLGELFPLPRAALGKRFGAGFLDWLQRLLGEKPDPLQPVAPSLPFRGKREFEQPLESLAALKWPMSGLLDELECWLNRRQEQITAIRWHLFLGHHQHDTLVVRRARPGHDAATWLDLSQRRLERYRAGAEVLALALDTGRPQPRNPALADLFPAPGARPPLSDLLEKLASDPALRLYRPWVADHHLPERGETRIAPLAPPAAPLPVSTPVFSDRPCWLLDPPLRLPDRNHRPSWRGQPLSLFPQQERFSQPWASSAPRAYRIAHHPDGLCCWVFQDHRQQWWLQGFF